MVAVSSKQLLLDELSEHNVFFDMIMDMIPSDLSSAGNSGGDFHPSKSKYHLEKLVHDRDIQRSKGSTGKGHREAQVGSFAKQNDGRSIISTQEIRERRCDDSASSEENFFESGQDISANQRTSAADTTTTAVNQKQSRKEELYAKLHAKIAAKQGERPSINPDQVSKRAARRVEKQRRRDEGAKQKEAGNEGAKRKEAGKTRKSDTVTGTAGSL
jgi:hypothetical protein